jgi:hypothetical protein
MTTSNKFEMSASAQEYYLANYTTNEPCGFCPCNNGTIPWKDMSMSAEWLNRIYDHEAFLATQSSPHLMLTMLPWVTILSFFADIMHVKHLGVDMNIAGSVLWILCFSGILTGIHNTKTNKTVTL